MLRSERLDRVAVAPPSRAVYAVRNEELPPKLVVVRARHARADDDARVDDGAVRIREDVLVRGFRQVRIARPCADDVEPAVDLHVVPRQMRRVQVRVRLVRVNVPDAKDDDEGEAECEHRADLNALVDERNQIEERTYFRVGAVARFARERDAPLRAALAEVAAGQLHALHARLHRSREGFDLR